MELGNAIFGSSRGFHEIKHRRVFESILIPFMEEVGVGDRGYDKEPDATYATFDNEVFTIRPYYWGEDDKIASLPNFIYKPTNFEIQWYKYPLRDSYMNQNITVEQFKEIINNCRKSLGGLN